MDERLKQFTAYVVDDQKSINEERRSVRFIISSNELDRDNEIVEVTAVEGAIREFARNPVCLACHQHRLAAGNSPVVGSWDTESFRALKRHAEMDLVFAKTELGEEYWTLYRDRHMRAVSIGFSIRDGHEEQKDGKRWYVITRIELYEISCVPVGANRDALAKLKGWPEGDGDERLKSLEQRLEKKFEGMLKDAVEDLRRDLMELIIDDPGGLADSLLIGGEPEPSAGCVSDAELVDALKRATN
jgi:HK97 family phage prohead protease